MWSDDEVDALAARTDEVEQRARVYWRSRIDANWSYVDPDTGALLTLPAADTLLDATDALVEADGSR